MRTKNAFRNLAFSLAYEVFVLALGLIVPRFIILSYGDSINGLTTTINRLLTLINLVQAGAVGASIYQMYKPVANNDYETQSAIMYSSKRFFRRMGCIYFALAIVAATFSSFYLQNDELKSYEIFLSFLVLAINGVLYFFFTSKFDIIFSSYQKRYLLNISNFVERIVYYGLLFLVMLGKMHFVYMYLALLLGGISRVIVNSIFYSKLTKGKINNNPTNKNYVIKDRKFLMLSSIGGEAVAAAPTVIITYLLTNGMALSSVYSIYALVYTSMRTVINSLHLSVSAIFGNLVATSEDEKIKGVFNVLVYMFVVLGTFLASCAAFLFLPFISLYTRGFTGISYYYPILAAFVVGYIILFSFRTVYGFVSTVYGLFKDTCKITLSVGCCAILVSIITTKVFGMPYVMVGVLLYHLLCAVLLIVVFKRKIKWFNFDKLAGRIILLVSLPYVMFAISRANIVSIRSWGMWIVTAIVCAIIVGAILILYSLCFERNELKQVIAYIKGLFLKKRKVSE